MKVKSNIRLYTIKTTAWILITFKWQFVIQYLWFSADASDYQYDLEVADKFSFIAHYFKYWKRVQGTTLYCVSKVIMPANTSLYTTLVMLDPLYWHQMVCWKNMQWKLPISWCTVYPHHWSESSSQSITITLINVVI